MGITIESFASSSSGNLYRVTDGVTPILLECGISFKELQKQLDFKTSELAGCLISHEHMDHAKAVKDLMKAGIDCYMSAGTAESLGVSGHRVKIIKSREQIKIGTWTVLPFDTQHDAAEPLGFLLAAGGEKLLFATDTYYVKYKFNGLTHIMVECNYVADLLAKNIDAGRITQSMKKRLMQSHFSLDNVKMFLDANDLSRVQEIHLLHLSDGNSDEARFKREIAALTGKPVYISPRS